MIIGLGTDLVEIARIDRVYQRHGERFARRILTPTEYLQFTDRQYCVAYLAKRFAAKEAIVKALGTGFRGLMQWQNIEVLADRLGKPVAYLLNGAAEQLEQQSTISITISDERQYALAFALYHRV
ncbi:MAG TPA: holo-ACP synthase [Halieaceae bacterium]|nr:holo-ACP synthase [Halieaceae bacterium]